MSSTATRRAILVFTSLGFLGLAGPAPAQSNAETKAPTTKAQTTNAKTLTFDVPLSAQNEVERSNSPGSGTAHLTYDPATREVTWSIDYIGFASPVTMAHLHGPARVGKTARPQIWLTKKGATDIASPITGHAKLTAKQARQFMDGLWYVNIHTKRHPSGAIRGQVEPPKA